MPVQKDQVRAQLVNIMAKRSSVEGVEALLENAVRFRDSKKIEVAASMLDDILSAKTKLTKDAYAGELRPEPCKTGDCEKGCFWLEWCEMKESFDLLADTRRTIRKSMRQTSQPLKRKDTRQRWGA